MNAPRPLVVAGALALALVGASVLALTVMGAPPQDVVAIAALLAVSGGLSLGVGALAIRWAGRRIPRLHLRIALASGVGLLIMLINVLMTSALMFLSGHDLTLLLLLLAFAAVISLAFAYAVAGALAAEIGELSRAARRLAEGDLSARVGGHGSDEVGRLAEAFDEMADQLERAFSRERSLEAGRRELVTAVSHDLRTPLATSRAMVEALADGVVGEPAEVQRYLRLILGDIQHLSRLIDDLFELSQIDSGALQLRCASVDLGLLVSSTLAAYEAPAAERGVRLERALAEVSLEADAQRLERVLRNLLDNALRHTPAAGTIDVRLTCSMDQAELRISDSGPGVPESELERIFDRFYRGERSRRREDSSGAGLGLAIARGLVQAHGGRIWAERSSLGGICMRIVLPHTPGAFTSAPRCPASAEPSIPGSGRAG